MKNKSLGIVLQTIFIEYYIFQCMGNSEKKERGPNVPWLT
jgi:hypothetical protein